MTLSSKMITAFKTNPKNNILKLLFYFIVVILGLIDLGLLNAILGSIFVINAFLVMLISFDLSRKLILNVPLDRAWWSISVINIAVLVSSYFIMGGFSVGIKTTLIIFILSPLIMVFVFDKLLSSK